MGGGRGGLMKINFNYKCALTKYFDRSLGKNLFRKCFDISPKLFRISKRYFHRIFISKLCLFFDKDLNFHDFRYVRNFQYDMHVLTTHTLI